MTGTVRLPQGLVTVVIATRNRSALLRQSLGALARQDWPPDRLEIIVADNGSTDATAGVVAEAASRARAAVRYLFVRNPGKSHAVNAATAIARGDLIAFIDDDVTPEPCWVSAIVTAVEETGTDFVAGRIQPIWEEQPPRWMSPALYGVLAIPDNGAARRIITAGDPTGIMPIGANMAVRASVLARIGGLRTDLGKLSGSLRTGEDHEFFLRLLRAGFVGVYEPGALVGHFVPAYRLVRGYFRRWLYQNGRDVARLERDYPATVPLLLGVPRYLWRSVASDVLTWLAALLRGAGPERFASSVRVIWFAGYLRESWSAPVPSPAACAASGGR